MKELKIVHKLEFTVTLFLEAVFQGLVHSYNPLNFIPYKKLLAKVIQVEFNCQEHITCMRIAPHTLLSSYKKRWKPEDLTQFKELLQDGIHNWLKLYEQLFDEKAVNNIRYGLTVDLDLRRDFSFNGRMYPKELTPILREVLENYTTN
jgi:hypothetical protein